MKLGETRRRFATSRLVKNSITMKRISGDRVAKRSVELLLLLGSAKTTSELLVRVQLSINSSRPGMLIGSAARYSVPGSHRYLLGFSLVLLRCAFNHTTGRILFPNPLNMGIRQIWYIIRSRQIVGL